MSVGQILILQHEYMPNQVFNMDETAISYGIGPEHSYIPRDAERGVHPTGSDEKIRITVRVITVNENGVFLPNF